jgi:hypothetical protein
MYISIYQDVDAVNPAKIGAEVSVNSTVDGNYQTRMVSNNPVSSKWGVLDFPKLFLGGNWMENRFVLTSSHCLKGFLEEKED